jgi:adenosylcobinamide kinase / adenosylcobinamide-phosphate guanylyltransferase
MASRPRLTAAPCFADKSRRPGGHTLGARQMTAARKVLVLGGARSGKSRTAQALVSASGLPPTLIATAQALDDEMKARIDRHRAERPAGWHLREEPLALAAAIGAEVRPDRAVLVDCLTLWLSNVMLDGRDLDDAIATLVEAIAGASGPLVLVSNEVGQGVIPAHALGRRFRDEQGLLNQAVATACDTVLLVVSGCPVVIKPAPVVITLA